MRESLLSILVRKSWYTVCKGKHKQMWAFSNLAKHLPIRPCPMHVAFLLFRKCAGRYSFRIAGNCTLSSFAKVQSRRYRSHVCPRTVHFLFHRAFSLCELDTTLTTHSFDINTKLWRKMRRYTCLAAVHLHAEAPCMPSRRDLACLQVQTASIHLMIAVI